MYPVSAGLLHRHVTLITQQGRVQHASNHDQLGKDRKHGHIDGVVAKFRFFESPLWMSPGSCSAIRRFAAADGRALPLGQ